MLYQKGTMRVIVIRCIIQQRYKKSMFCAWSIFERSLYGGVTNVSCISLFDANCHWAGRIYFNVSSLLWQWTPVLMSFTSIAKRLLMKPLLLVWWPGFKYHTFRMRGKRSIQLRHRHKSNVSIQNIGNYVIKCLTYWFITVCLKFYWISPEEISLKLSHAFSDFIW